ncbi:MAG TPA: NAD+ synthase [Bacteroidota bacterium]|nr:NAD+ synthase [Bacteroidota bacterium]
METSTHVADGTELHLNTDLVRKMLVDFVRDQIRNAGFSKAVVGLSGGIDSAVSAYLSCEALGKENVHAVLMPYRTSSPESTQDAELIVREIGIHSEIVDITPMVEPLFTSQKITDNVRRGNVMARMRMIVLYDRSLLHKALVVGTSNKTETMLGYGTLFGDMACALNPLGDLYKSQIWQLAEALGVPKKIIDKKPTADLWQNQTDEGELGFSYKDVDRLLYYMIDERRTDDELISMGISRRFISDIRKKVSQNQFKRRPPVIAKISQRTVNVDFRYVRDWGI